MTVADNSCHEEIVCQLEEQYPKLKQLSGGWLCYKSTGGQGQRKLIVVATESEGYTGRLLKTVTNNGKLILYIVPLQEELDASPLPHNAPEFSKMPKSSCKNCGVVMPLQFLALHIKSCNAEISSDEPEIVSIEEKEVNTTEVCPICENQFPREDIAYHASFCGDGFPADTLMPLLEDDAREGTSSTIDLLPHGSRTTEQSTSPTGVVNDMAGPSTMLADPTVPEWKRIMNASSAATLFRRVILREQQLEIPLRFSMDLHSDVEEREKAVIAFYKTQRTKWASPLHCVLEGDAAIGDGVSRYFISFAMQTLQSGFHINFGNADVTRLFEGQKDHLIPCASQPLIDSDLFLMAGRMVGHSFIHGGPGLPGISPAVVHVLLGGQLETATLVLEDCPDIDRRNTIQLLDGNRELSEDQKAAVNSLADMWELPRLTNLNRQYLHQRLLQHAILGRTASQIKQMRKGLKETGVWSILSERRDVAEAVFPCEKEVICSPQVMIDHIIWPTSEVVEDDDEEFPLETRAKIGMYLRHFIETAPATSRMNLLKFWTGWEVLSGQLKLEVVRGEFPKSSTCYQSLRIPGHFSTYEELKQALEASIGTSDTGFGLI
ncbi:uncharacterized protein LOC109082021 isoform X1 [Cyprinus carpio]|uniref:Uncharacterized protein LOC109082021 isoform X1 n=2 Tax=Cyprinus carpio TaxID=7962 RepID=A0A9R0ARD8_CYPCA|nr:uncharacterized protein LOC109082021 isoform X1 [Cyprinus carpio]